MVIDSQPGGAAIQPLFSGHATKNDYCTMTPAAVVRTVWSFKCKCTLSSGYTHCWGSDDWVVYRTIPPATKAPLCSSNKSLEQKSFYYTVGILEIISLDKIPRVKGNKALWVSFLLLFFSWFYFTNNSAWCECTNRVAMTAKGAVTIRNQPPNVFIQICMLQDKRK